MGQYIDLALLLKTSNVIEASNQQKTFNCARAASHTTKATAKNNNLNF
jgi:hypothetical protein